MALASLAETRARRRLGIAMAAMIPTTIGTTGTSATATATTAAAGRGPEGGRGGGAGNGAGTGGGARRGGPGGAGDFGAGLRLHPLRQPSPPEEGRGSEAPHDVAHLGRRVGPPLGARLDVEPDAVVHRERI